MNSIGKVMEEKEGRRMIKGEKYAAIIGFNPSKGARSPKLNKAYEKLNQKNKNGVY